MLDHETFNSAWRFLIGLSPFGLFYFFWFTLLFEIPRYLLSFAVTVIAIPSDRWQRTQLMGPVPRSSILIACHNEEASVRRCVSSLREQIEADFEIVCIDDGSSDRTFAVMQQLEREGRITRAVRCQLRGGKSSAINLAARLATTDVFVVVDSDCSFDRDAIVELLRPFSDPEVMAVSGNILIRNWGASIIASLQAIEYLIGISLGKTASNLFNQVSCVSGAFGAFRRVAWVRVGGMDVGGGEDFDITMRLRIAGMRIAFARKAICYTDAPETLTALAGQRDRWERDAFWTRFRKFKRTLAPFSGRVHWQETIHQLDFVVFNVLAAAVFPIYLFLLFSQYGAFSFFILLAAGLALYLLDGLCFALAVWVAGKPQCWRLMPFLLIYGPFQSYVMRFIRLRAYIAELIFSKSRSDNYVPAKVRAWSVWR